MKKVFYGAAIFGALLLSSCENTFKDIYGDVDEDSKPEWLGGSIYSELQNTSSGKLTGSFSTYLRLIDDLGYAETLNRTGSKTIFPANDEAFSRFFASNQWGVSSYEDLTYSQKKLLLYSSMLDNALLVGMLSNVANSSAVGGISDGMALKHPSNISVIDSVTQITPDQMPLNNTYWDEFRQKGQTLWGLYDYTTPPIVHFTREQMVNNGISTAGDNSDFAILTGEPYTEGTAYVFNDKVINADVTCLNGYIHQVQDVLVQPGSMAQVIAKESDTKYFSHILDYYKIYKRNDQSTENYNAWVRQNRDLAAQNGYQLHDQLYDITYISSAGYYSDSNKDPNGTTKPTNEILNYDPGWNGYYPNSKRSSDDVSRITDMGAMFVPTDDALWNYFKGRGAFIINEYGEQDASGNVINTREKLLTNLDLVHQKNPVILTSFINNIQKTSFNATVPSKFSEIINDASELLNMSVDSLIRKDNGKYDIIIANNGVIYKVKGVLAPDRYRSVLGPVCTYHDMKVMDWAVEESYTGYLGMDFQYYLLAMKANYAFCIPDDDAFANPEAYYLDPTSINWDTKKAKLIHFWYDKSDRTLRSQQYLGAASLEIDLTTGAISPVETLLDFNSNKAQIQSALCDILNYHTIVLSEEDDASGNSQKDVITVGNKYYRTKHGAEVLVEQKNGVWTLKSGSQIDNLLPQDGQFTMPASNIKVAEKEDNGYAYRISHLIQPTIQSVSQVLKNDDRFSEFYNLCTGFDNPTLLRWIGFSDVPNQFKTTEQKQMLIFTTDYSSTLTNLSLATEGNVKMFNTYHYTLYAPDNDAMEEAYQAGLPRWDDIQALYQQVTEALPDQFGNNQTCPEPYASVLKEKVNKINDFCKYHFQNISIYADNTLADGNGYYQSLYAPKNMPLAEYHVSCSGGVITLRDGGNVTHTINANDAAHKSNIMTRDYWLNNERGSSSNGIRTSSFCVVHELTNPLYFDTTRTYNAAWAADEFTAEEMISALSGGAKKRAAAKAAKSRRTK